MNKISNIVTILLFLVMLLVLIVPIFPIFPGSGLDPSWLLGIDYLIARDFQFGPDIIFTYGPFGNFWFPNILYNQDKYLVQVVTGILLSVLIAFATLFSFFDLTKGRFIFLSFALTVSLVAGGALSFFLLQLLFVTSIIKSSNKYGLLLSYMLIIAMDFSSLVKISHFPTSMLLVLLADVLLYLKHKKYPVCTLIFFSGFLILFIISGQNINNIINYFHGSMQIISGFSDAMQTSGGKLIIVILFLVLSGWMIVLMIKELLQRKDLDRTFITLALMLMLFMGFKAGFVRFDAHAVQAFGILLMIAVFLYGLQLNYKFYTTLLLTTLFSTIIVYAHYSDKETLVLVNAKYREYKQKISELPAVFSRGKIKALDQSYEMALNNIKISDPLPALQGTVDIYPWNIASVIAHGLEYQPRPVFQSYSVYTEKLINKNKDHLQSKKAPDNILFDIQEIDGRLPSMMEGGNWLDILNRYDVSDLLQNYVLLSKHGSHKKKYSLEDLQVNSAHFDKDIVLPENIDAIWCSVDIQKSFFGKILNTLYRSPVLYIEITFVDGKTIKNRIVPSIAKSGFILSPGITSKDDFIRFNLNPDLFSANSNAKVVSIKITGQVFYELAYKKTFTINFQKIKFIKTTQEIIHSKSIKKMLSYSRFLNNSNAQLVDYKGNRILFSHIPGYMIIDVNDSGTKKKLSFEYAIKEEAYLQGSSKGACFSITAYSSLSETELFKHCIDPKNILSDRGIHSSSMMIDKNITKLKFNTLVNQNDDSSWGWTYWRNITFD